MQARRAAERLLPGSAAFCCHLALCSAMLRSCGAGWGRVRLLGDGDVMGEWTQRPGLPYPDDNSCACFVLKMEEKGGCKAQKVAGWLCKVHQTRMALLILTPPGIVQLPAKATTETHLVFETQQPPSSI